MTLIGMPDAAVKLGLSFRSAKRALKNANVPLVAINARALAVEEVDLETLIASRPIDYKGRGRPPGAKNKPKADGKSTEVQKL